MLVQKRKNSLINGRSILYIFLVRKMTSFRQNQEKPILLPINGHVFGALLSRAHDGHIIKRNTQYMKKKFEKSSVTTKVRIEISGGVSSTISSNY